MRRKRTILRTAIGKPHAVLVSVISVDDYEERGNYITKMCTYEQVSRYGIWKKDKSPWLVAREEQLQQAWG